MGETEKLHGTIIKSASISATTVDKDELKKINKFTLSPLSEDEVFSFKLVLCDNEVDRDFEAFSLKSLQQLKKLFVGRTLIKDHTARADNQVARIYDAELVQNGSKTTKYGDLYTQLVAKAYMVKTADNESLIAEIKAGIKKEVSVSCSVKSAICSICGTDNRKDYCRHFAGREYEANGSKSVCSFTLDNVTDAYEVSLVAIPAQRNAGTCKSYGDKVFSENDIEHKSENKQSKNEDSVVDCKIKLHESFIFNEKQKELSE